MSDDLDEQIDEDEKRARDEVDRAFREVLATPAGKRVLFWMLEQASVYRDAFTGDNDATNYELGRQSSSRRLLAQLDHIDPRAYPLLLLDVADLKAMDIAAARAAALNLENDDAED